MMGTVIFHNFFTIFSRIFYLQFNKRIGIFIAPLILEMQNMAENTMQSNSLAAFLGSIKFNTEPRGRDLDYPSIPLAGFNSSLKSLKDASSEEVEFILSEN